MDLECFALVVDCNETFQLMLVTKSKLINFIPRSF
jgi:hypothetical protein